MRYLFLTMMVVVLAGCAGMNEQECGLADWQAIGFEDGSLGKGAAAFGYRRKACSEHGVAPDFQAYRSGHDEGISLFCRAQNGYQLGTTGYRYTGVCPTHLETTFLTAHAAGFGLYERRQKIKRLSSQLHAAKERSLEIEHELAEATVQIAAPGTAVVTRANLAVELTHLTQERIELSQTIPELEFEYQQAEEDFEAYRAAGAYRPAP